MPTNQERRQDHRIRYPFQERPQLQYADRTCVVLDISARGLRYAIPDSLLPKPYEPVKGILRFRHNTPIAIDGAVVRAQNGEVALYLHQEIPFAVLLAEQRYLHQHYPMWS